MADYSVDQKEFYEDVKEDGGSITILIPARQDEDPQTDPNSNVIDTSIWKGDDAEPDEKPHYILFDYENRQSTDKSKFLAKGYIPAYDLEFELTSDMLIKDARGNIWQITSCQPYAPDGKDNIFYTCEMVRWPQS